MRKIKLLGVLLLALLCTGCQTRELEDRGFPLAIGIDKSEEGMVLSFDFPDLSQTEEGGNPCASSVSFSVEAGAYYAAQKAYENNTNKVLDYNHLKAVILGEEFVADPEALRQLLAWLEQEEMVARNISLFVAKGTAAQIMGLTKETSGSLGKYLEQMVKNQRDFKENKIVTIGDLMNQWHNQNELLLLPVLTDNGGVPSITEYGVMDAFSYKRTVSVEEAMKGFLCQELLAAFSYHLKSGALLEITNIGCDLEIEEQQGTPHVTIKLTGDAREKIQGLAENHTNAQLKKQLNKELKEDLEETAMVLLQEPGMDISNSFYLLGGYHRGLYQQYRQDYLAYQQQVKLEFLVDMDVINE